MFTGQMIQVTVTNRHLTQIQKKSVNTFGTHLNRGVILQDQVAFKENYFARVKNKQFTYMWSEKSDVLVTSPTTQLQEIILIPRWLISLATISILQTLHKVTWKYNLTMN